MGDRKSQAELGGWIDCRMRAMLYLEPCVLRVVSCLAWPQWIYGPNRFTKTEKHVSGRGMHGQWFIAFTESIRVFEFFFKSQRPIKLIIHFWTKLILCFLRTKNNLVHYLTIFHFEWFNAIVKWLWILVMVFAKWPSIHYLAVSIQGEKRTWRKGVIWGNNQTQNKEQRSRRKRLGPLFQSFELPSWEDRNLIFFQEAPAPMWKLFGRWRLMTSWRWQ